MLQLDKGVGGGLLFNELCCVSLGRRAGASLKGTGGRELCSVAVPRWLTSPGWLPSPTPLPWPSSPGGWGLSSWAGRGPCVHGFVCDVDVTQRCEEGMCQRSAVC